MKDARTDDKNRPCLALSFAMTTEEGMEVVRVLPITHTPPGDPANAIEIPAEVKARLRFDHERSWIVLTDSNGFVWPGPDLRHIDTDTGYCGELTPGVFSEERRRLEPIAHGEMTASTPHRSVPRTT